MTEQRPDTTSGPGQGSSHGDADDQRVIVVGPNQMAVAGGDPDADDHESSVTDLVEQPAKVMRIGSMIRQLLDEVKSAPVDEASRARLAKIYASSIEELKSGLAPELVDELERLSSPFASDAPSESELRVAKAQLVGWLEGLFHGIQTAIYAQQMAARAQLEQMRRALPMGSAMPGQQHEGPPGSGPASGDSEGRSSGMYL